MAAVEQSAIDPEHVAATLAEFTELWDVLYPQEKTRIVHLLVERVVYDGDQGGIQLIFGSRSHIVAPVLSTAFSLAIAADRWRAPSSLLFSQQQNRRSVGEAAET